MATQRVTLQGGKELLAKLNKLGELGQTRVLRNAVFAGLLPITNEAQRLAPYKSGTLRRSIHPEIVTERNDYVEGATGTDVIYAAQREFGGTITAKNAPYLVFKTEDGRLVRVRSVTQTAKPYMRPALDSKRTEAVDEVRDALLDQLNKLIS
jgi:HK97 gp10 family phage protein